MQVFGPSCVLMLLLLLLLLLLLPLSLPPLPLILFNFVSVSEMTYTVSSGTLNPSIPYLNFVFFRKSLQLRPGPQMFPEEERLVMLMWGLMPFLSPAVSNHWHNNKINLVARTTRVSWYQDISILDFIRAKDDGDGGDNWSYTPCEVPVKSSPPTNQPSFFTGQIALLCQANSVNLLKECILFSLLIAAECCWSYTCCNVAFSRCRLT